VRLSCVEEPVYPSFKVSESAFWKALIGINTCMLTMPKSTPSVTRTLTPLGQRRWPEVRYLPQGELGPLHNFSRRGFMVRFTPTEDGVRVVSFEDDLEYKPTKAPNLNATRLPWVTRVQSTDPRSPGALRACGYNQPL
jgi:hypothetical protein